MHSVTAGRDWDLGVVLGHEREAAPRPILEGLLAARGWGTPDARAAAARLLDHDAPWATDLAPGEAFLVGAPSAHQAALFLDWLQGAKARTLETIGRQRGMNAPAVGDALARAGRRMRAVLDQAPPPWPWLVAELRRRLGSVTTEDLLGDALERSGARRGSLSASLAAWLAGPYSPVRGHPGWVATHPASLLSRSALSVRADGGVRLLADVSAELADLELCPGMVVPWLQAFGAVVVHELVVSTAGPLADAVERILDAHGTTRTVPQIAEDLVAGGRTVTDAALAAAVRARRFRMLEDGAVGLAAWGDVGPRGHATPAVRGRRQARARSPEPTRVDHRPGRLPGAPRGTATERSDQVISPDSGAVRSRAPRDATEVPEERAREPVRLWVRVDEAVLRGEEGVVPTELVERLGLGAQSRRTFSCRWGPVTLAYEGLQPVRGSLRAVARAVGARSGDTLMLGFSPAGDVAVELRGMSNPAPHTDPGRAVGVGTPPDPDAAFLVPEASGR